MKKLLAVLLIAVLCLGVFLVSCGDGTNGPADTTKPGGDVTPTPTLDGAKAFLINFYGKDANPTNADYTLSGSLTFQGTTFTVEWTVDVEDVKLIKNDDGSYTVDVDEKSPKEVEYYLTATIKNAAGESITATFKRVVPAYRELSHADFVATKDGQAVVIQGVVTGIVETSKENDLYLEDEDGGYFVYALDKKPSEMGIQIGMTVKVAGTRGTYYGVNQVVDASVEIIDETIKTVTPTDITDIFNAATDTKDATLLAKQSMLVTIKGVTILGQDAGNNTYYNFSLNGKTTYVRISSSTSMIDSNAIKTFESIVSGGIGKTADVTGIVTIYNNAMYLVPVTAEAFHDLKVVERTPAEQVEFEKGFIKVDALINESGAIELPATGNTYKDVTVTWAVTGGDFAKIEGGKLIVSLPEKETKITLTATLKNGDATATATFEVTVAAAPTKVPSVINGIPEAGKPYKFYLKQVTNKTNLYLAGGMNGYYLATTQDVAEAVDVYVELVPGKTDEYYIYYLDGEIKNYIKIYEAVNSSNGKIIANVGISKGSVSENTYKFNSEINTFVTTITVNGEEKTYYIGTYNTFSTFSPSETSRVTGNNASAVGVTQFVAQFTEMVDVSNTSDEDKVKTEKDSLTIPSDMKAESSIDLPLFGITYSGVTVTWTADNALATIEGGKLTVGAPTADTEITLTATLKSGTVTDTKTFKISVKAPTASAVTEPVAGTAYLFTLYQATNGKQLYIDGTVSGRYLGMTTDVAKAVNVYAEAVTGGFKFYIIADGVKQYITVYNNDEGKTSVKYDVAGNSVYTYVAETNIWMTNLDGADKYLGTYSTYDTVSASDTRHITAENTGVSQFPLELIAAGTTPEQPGTPEEPEKPTDPITNAVTAPVAGNAYKFALYQATTGNLLYIDGTVSTRYLGMTTDVTKAVNVYAEAVTGGYKFYIIVDGAKQYITVYNNADGKTSVNYDPNGTTVYTYVAETNIWMTNFGGTDMYLGTYNNFETVSASKTSYITAENTGVSQFPLELVPSADAPETPDEPETPSNEIKVNTVNSYGFNDMAETPVIDSFTATEAGFYTFNIPAGLGLWSKAAMDANPYGGPEVEFMDNYAGETYTVELAAGEVFEFYVGAMTEEEWVITWSFSTDAPAEEEEIWLEEGDNTVSVTDTVAGTTTYLSVYESATYTFTVEGAAILVYNSYGMPLAQGIGAVQVDLEASYMGYYTVVIGSDNAGDYTVNVAIAKPAVLEDGENTVNVTADGITFNYYAENAGNYTFTVGAGVTVVVTDSFGDVVEPVDGQYALDSYSIYKITLTAATEGEYTVTVGAPIFLSTYEETTVKVDGTTTVFFMTDSNGKYTLSGEGLTFVITDAEGNVVENGSALEGYTVYTVKVTAAAAGEYSIAITFEAEVGSYENPEKIENLPATVKPTLDSVYAYYYFEFTATETGHVTLTLNGNAVVGIDNFEIAEGETTLTVPVVAGKTYTVCFSSDEPAEVEATLTFAAGALTADEWNEVLVNSYAEFEDGSYISIDQDWDTGDYYVFFSKFDDDWNIIFKAYYTFTVTANEDGTVTVALTPIEHEEATGTAPAITALTAEIGEDGWILTVTLPEGDEDENDYTSITDALDIAISSGDTYTEEKYVIAGYILSVANTEYGNLTITDLNGNNLYIYGLYSADGSVGYKDMDYQPVKGDYIVISTVLGCYYGSPQAKSAWLVEVKPHTEHTWMDATCTAPKTCSVCEATEGVALDHVYVDGVCSCGREEGSNALSNAKLSFSDASNRTEFSASKQVWSKDGVTMINNKAGSTSDVANYTNPVRIYASSSVTIEGIGMKTVVFEVNSGKPVTGLTNGLAKVAGATVTTNGYVVTVTFEEPVDSFTFTVSAQVRFDAIIVNP